MVDVALTGLPAPRLRQLDDDEFRERYGCDRFTATVLANRFRYVVAHMSNQFRWHAFSSYIRDAADLCGTFSGPPALGYPMAAVSETLPLFYGSIPDAIRIVIEEYGPEKLAPGDTLIVNDYFRVGTHFNDTCCIRPVFFEGELVGAVAIRAHLLDMGGSVFGGWSMSSRSTYQNGLRVPPMPLYLGGEKVKSTFRLLYDNSRTARDMIPDLETEYHALALAERLLQETIAKYGYDAYAGAIRYACDASDESMRDALTSIPDGVYEGVETLVTDGFPDSPEYHVRVRITKVGDRAEFDLTGTSPETRGSINCTWPDAKTAVAMALKLLVDPRNPMTSGTLRNVDIVLPPAAICNAHPPRACQYYYVVVMAIVHAVFRALNPVLGPDAVGGAYMADFGVVGESLAGTSEEYPDNPGFGAASGPWGATRHGDGDSGQQPHYMNLNITGGVETSETMFPDGVVLRSEYLPDSGGPGTHRGGAASAHASLARSEARRRRLFDQPVGGGGAFGGRAGRLSAFRRYEADEPDRSILPLSAELPGPVAEMTTSGGGGWGDPLARDVQRVLRDVRDGYVSVTGAARDYGVVIDGDPDRFPEQLRVDERSTTALRARLLTSAEPLDVAPPGSNGAEREHEREHERVDGVCPVCGAAELRRHPVLGAEGWVEVVKCGRCLRSVSRERWNRLGYVTLPDDAL